MSGRDLDELEVACERVEEAAHQAYLDLQPLYGQQDLGFTRGRASRRPRAAAFQPARSSLMSRRA